ncbi:general odorant-binding protein 57d [Drosophila rhopaloa]|uniref:General odorant-binding protein 57d n=1 Tax=Drosophila rhopaloa TaxID=1041015 RepID=A0A6P4FHS1_DRORH|nr:general odorant-binding protein 57d [Drosophila rhopaloa]
MSVKLEPRLIFVLFLLRCQFVNGEIPFTDPCTDHNGITDEQANNAFKDWPEHLNLASVNKTHKCYVTCILIYYNIVDNYGKISLDKYFDNGSIDEYAFAPTLLRCRYEYRKETDLCEQIFGIFNCFKLLRGN